MKKRKMSRSTQIFISLGLVFTSGTLILHDQFPSMPDLLRGLLEGLGLGLMIIGLIRHRKEGNTCTRTAGTGEDVIKLDH